MKIIKKILKLIFWLFLALLLIAVGYYFAVTKDAKLSASKLLLSNKSFTIYDADNKVVNNTIPFKEKQSISIEEIPKTTQFAFIDIEDRHFFEHNGFDAKRIGKAAYKNLRAGRFKEGASTISQQLIKNTHLTHEKTLNRKLKEWKLTRTLEKKYTKKEILEKYLNSIYFGHNCFGLRAASAFYFEKSPSNLTIAESAILAGLVQSPNNFSPFKNPQLCEKRKSVVLQAMHNNGHINKAELTNALNEPLPIASKKRHDNDGYLHFVFDELSDLLEQHTLLLDGKIEIYTYLDTELQSELKRQTDKISDCDKCILVLDGKSGGFKGCISSVGNIQRLPGSLIKPLLVYAPALESNLISPATPILDDKVNYNGYTPENYEKKYHGYVSARECVAKSLNIPAVKLLQSLGIKQGIYYLEKMSLKVLPEDESLALALGGMKHGFTMKNLTAAYSTLQNQGVYKDCRFIKEIKVNGKSLYRHKPNYKRVFSENTSYLMTDILKTTAKSGTAKKLRTLTFDIAAKTGTVGNENGNTDAYAISYTANDCIGVWLGNADNTHMDYTGGGLPCNLLYSINEYLSNRYKRENIPLANFATPDGVTEIELDKTAYYDTHTILKADPLSPKELCMKELFKKDATPLKTSDFFSNPSILPPSISIENDCVIITLSKGSPVCYQYKIDRYDYVTHTTVYQGDFIPSFVDKSLEKDKKYLYTVTPIYNGKEGTSITLPLINTKQGERINMEEKQILTKDWWEY